MRIRFLKQLVYGILLMVIFTNTTVKAIAAEDSVEFTDRYHKIEVKDDNDLFSDMKELLPGDNAVSSIKLKNSSVVSVNFYLYAVVNKNSAVVQDKVYAEKLIKLLELTLRKNGTELVYQGPASGNPVDAKAGQTVFKSMVLDASNTVYGINLGTVQPGEVMNLSAEILVPGGEVGNEYQNSYALVDWKFCCEGIEPTPTAIPIVIPPPVVPNDAPTISPSPTVTPPVTIEVPDDPTPAEPPLPKTGSYALYFKQVGAILFVLVLGLVILERVRKSSVNKK